MTPKQLRETILWLRKERISYTSLIAGGIELHGVTDGKALVDDKPQPAQERPSMYQRYGGELLRQPTAKANEIVPDEALSD